MKNLNSIKKKIAKEDFEDSVTDTSRLLAEFFNGVVVQIYE